MECNTMALQVARTWSLVSFERVWKAPVFLSERMLTPASSVHVFRPTLSLTPSCSPNRHVIVQLKNDFCRICNDTLHECAC
jgi:hypothetical protein